MEQEFQLRDINESIFEGYTKASIFFLLAIAVFGSLQIVFYWAYLKKKKLL
jgi:emp24/gp25L/p24 family/GOLD.